ncbi:N-6 DNA methylase [Aliiglaciecola sp. 2_MG-2023]|uniref:restriction endonuclease subunit M n=1 Tax=unclassified Aliiglaciecola TaxID=2593648 RepID=UPI0026E327C9|nr:MULTISPECIES: N-6 DNA methylase [unclassified Aliiglaciecola]MDO6711173.1 N-6 DNA methylase [Aliiglaciecola sp. 2_MG-2023]MDO6752087.1 N-6 DNA methylase [Aliiglaciecola sp. 1_MG-2023]
MELKEGYILDYISGLPVKATPEEIDAVQVFSEILVVDYGYPVEHIQTRPQWRVKVRPSDNKKEYPIDIGVFGGEEHTEENVEIIIECKKKNRKDGRGQLEDYLRFSKARIGVWFNGDEREYIYKTEVDGRIEFNQIPNIPRYGERVEDIGKFKRKDLRPATNLKSVFKTIRNYLAANAVGITRDEVFAQQLINLIFCKIYDERFTRKDQMVTFRSGTGESPENVMKRIVALFEKVKQQYDDVIEVADSIILDEKSLAYVVGELQLYSLQDSARDAVGDAFEVFIGPSLKGGQGQFFTPRNVVKMVIDMVDPTVDQKIIDPACGSGGFLVEGLRHVWAKIDKQGKELGWPDNEIEAEKQKVAIKNFRGIDKDYFLSKVAKAYMAILGDGRGGVYCENSLETPTNWSNATNDGIQMGKFDLVVTNPPFGKKLAIDSEDMLKKYDLGHKWKHNSSNDNFEKGKLEDKQPPQILFIERCLNLLTEGGTLGIVLLESIFGMPKYRYVVDYIERKTNIKAIVTMPEDLFQPHTHAKCCVLICEKKFTGQKDKKTPIFMADVKWCGHDSRGNPTIRKSAEGVDELLDDIPKVADIYRKGFSNK